MFDPSQVGTVCLICRQYPPIQNSHVIPKFVFRWMSETGITPYLRHGATPNRRVQDGLKAPLLCQVCEQLASKIEKEFAEKIFVPSTQDKPLPRKVGRYFHDFACIVHLRVAGSFLPKCEELNIKDWQKELLTIWIDQAANYLRGERITVLPNRLYLLPLGFGVPTQTIGYPKNWYRYIRRSTELDLVTSDSENLFATYFKAGPWLSFCLMRNRGQAWIGGEAISRTQKVKAEKMVFPPSVLDYLKFRAGNTARITQQLSEKQKAKIDAETRASLQSGKGEEMIKVILEDYETFGPDGLQ